MARMIEEITLKLELSDELRDYVQKEITRAIAERVPVIVADVLRARNKRKHGK